MKYHIVLTKKDADIAAFKKSLPKGAWSKHVELILSAALRDRIADIPMSFCIEPPDENLHTKISLPDKLIERCREQLGDEKGSLTGSIKAEIRRCIRKNLKVQPAERFSSTDVDEAFGRAFDYVNEKSKQLGDIRDKYKLVHKEYRRAFNLMRDTFSNLVKKGNL